MRKVTLEDYDELNKRGFNETDTASNKKNMIRRS